MDLIGKEDPRRRVVQAVMHQGLTPRRPGRPECGGRLEGCQLATIVGIIREKCSNQLQMPSALRTREAVRDLIEMRFGIRYSLGMTGRLSRRWEFTPQKPVTRAYEREDQAICDWLEHQYPVLKKKIFLVAFIDRRR